MSKIQREEEKMKNKEKGVTLIILVVTIVVILILAAITVNISFNDNGIIKKAEAIQGEIDATVADNENRMNELANKVSEGTIDGGGGLIPDTNKIEEGGGENPESGIPGKPKATVKGTEGEPGYYRSDVEIIVTSNDRSDKLTYTVEGTGIEPQNITTETEILNGQSIYITKDGTYTITIYEYNRDGKKSEPTIITLVRDTVPPQAELAITGRGEDTITVQLAATDPEPSSGLASENPYTFYYKKEGSTEWIEAGKGSTSTYTYTGLEEGETYTFKAEVTDKAGNTRTSTEAQAKTIDNRPQITLKEENKDGPDYEQGVWTNKNIYAEIKTETEKEVEKYQYSFDGTRWMDISEEVASAEVTYTMNFPQEGTKPDFIGELTANNANYYFVENGEGGLFSNNQGKHSTTATSYIPIDLTSYTEEQILNITINATGSGESNCDIGFATITESTTLPSYSNATRRILYLTGAEQTGNYPISIPGGKLYYLHLGYKKDGSVNTYQDELEIHSITFQSDTIGKGINFYHYTKTDNTITFTLEEDIQAPIQIRAVNTDGTTSKNRNCDIKIDKTAPKIQSVQTQDYVTIDKATIEIQAKETGAGLAGYYLSTEETAPTEASEWTSQENNTFTIENIQADTTYYLWLKDKVGNISQVETIQIPQANYQIDTSAYTVTLEQAIEKAHDGSTITLLQDYTDESTVNFKKGVTFDTGNYTLERNKTITINSGKNVTIQGNGIISSGTVSVNTISNSGNLTVKGKVTIQSLYTYSGYNAIYNYVSTTVQEEATIKGPYGIYNNGTGYMVNQTGGTIIGTVSDGIYNGTVTITGGKIEGNRYGIYGRANNKVTIGDNTKELSITEPSIYGKTKAVYMDSTSYSFNFYSGKLLSDQEVTYTGILNPREGYIDYTYHDYEEHKNKTILILPVTDLTIQATPDTWTNQNVEVTIQYPTQANITKEYSLDGEHWTTEESIRANLIIQENTTVYARILDTNKIVLQETQKQIDYIDKIEPTITIEPPTTRYYITDTNPNANIEATIKVQDEGGSGIEISKYAWTAEGEEPTYMDFENEIQITKNVTQGTYYLWLQVTDKAGNTAELTKLPYIVDYLEPVAQIGETTYTTIQDAIDACTAEEQTTIILLKSTDEECIVPAEKNIILDLKGYTVSSVNQEKPILENNGIIQLIDTSEAKTGKLEKMAGTAISNKGTLTLGDNTNELEKTVPVIYGNKIGIENTGIFNYYDGSISGRAPIKGNITNTLEGYGPVASSYEGNITTVTLDIVADYVARIDYHYYATLQTAIDACTAKANNLQQEEITILKDIVLTETATIYKGQNIKLDLDRYAITSSVIERGITNNGDLEIADESLEQTGKIEISGSGKYKYGIYNDGTGIVKVSRRNS